MYGEGHYTPMHSHRQGELIGAIPVGIDCIGGDEPFWSAGTNHTDKEIWVFPVARLIWSLSTLGLPAHLDGQGDSPLTFVDTATASEQTILPYASGRFRCNLPAGEYIVRGSGDEWRLRLVSGRNYRFDLRAGRGWAAQLAATENPPASNRRQLRLAAAGRGRHAVELRLTNARSENLQREITLTPGRDSVVEWELEIIDPAQPWMAAVIPDGNHDLLLHVIAR